MLVSQGQRLEVGIVDVVVGEHLSNVGHSPITSRLALRPLEHITLQVVQASLGGPGPGRGLSRRIGLGFPAPLGLLLRLIRGDDLRYGNEHIKYRSSLFVCPSQSLTFNFILLPDSGVRSSRFRLTANTVSSKLFSMSASICLLALNRSIWRRRRRTTTTTLDDCGCLYGGGPDEYVDDKVSS